jgi:hypothetical protein
LERGSDNLALRLLGEIDLEIRKNQQMPLDRSLLLATLIFPLFEEQIKERAKIEERLLHLGQITEEAHHSIDQVFNPFFSIPRRMRAIIAFLLTTQFRFIPIDGRPVRKPRIPRDSLFPMALYLFKLRAAVEAELLPHYALWTEASFASHEAGQAFTDLSYHTKKRRKRRRRRGSKPDTSHEE